jgi:hypothetical protein
MTYKQIGEASFEYSLNDFAWTTYAGPLPYSEGQRSLKFRSTDQAGNTTVTPAQAYFVDKTPPVIDLSDSLKPGVTENYKISDDGSGVGGTRVVIHDGQERYPKVAWGDGELAASFTGEIYWDGRFADGTVAPAGDYFVTVWLDCFSSMHFPNQRVSHPILLAKRTSQAYNHPQGLRSTFCWTNLHD